MLAKKQAIDTTFLWNCLFCAIHFFQLLLKV